MTTLSGPPVFYQWVGTLDRLRVDHDGYPLVLPGGADDNGAGIGISLSAVDIATLVEAGILSPLPPDLEALVKALEVHVGPTTPDISAMLGVLLQLSPETAADVYLALIADHD